MRPWDSDSRNLDRRDYELMGLPRRHWQTSFDEIVDVGDPSPREVVGRYLDDLHEMRTNGHGLFLWGPNESGKSAIAAHVLKAYRSHGQATLFARSEMIRRATIDDVPVAGRDLWTRAQSVDVLVVDDLGKEHESGSGYARSQLELLVRERYANGRVTMFTTNLTPDNISDALKTSTINVITSTATAVKVEGAEHRTERAADMHAKLLGAE